jgi:LDH2 family malate/lactate/ureidoglycolate dehydrogenase
MAIDPDLMVGREQFKENISDMIAKIKSSRVKEGGSIRLPGENAQQQYKAAENSGEVEIDDAVASEIGIFGDKS